MKKIFKSFLLIFVILAVAGGMLVGLTGCKDTAVVLTVNTMFGDGDNHNATYLELNKKFSEETGYTVVDKSDNATTNAAWGKSVADAVNAESGSPDIIFYFSASVDGIKDNLVPLVDLLSYTNQAYAGNNKMLFAADDYGVPIKTGSQAIMYNKGYLSGSDFSTLEGMISAINDSTETAAVSADLPHYWLNHLLVYHLGYTEYKVFDGTKAFFTEAKKASWTEALKKSLNDMRSIKGFSTAVSKDYDNGTQSAAFWAGTRSLSIDGQWTASSFESAAAKSSLAFANFPKPVNEETGFYIGGVTTGWYVTKSGWADEAKRDAIIKYIAMHTSDDALNKYCVAGGGTPANKKELTGATTAASGFASVTYDKEELVAIDDRMLSKAKTALMGDFTTASGAPKLLVQEGDVTDTQALALLNEMIAELV